MNTPHEIADESEKSLLAEEDIAEGLRRSDTYAGASGMCDICGVDLTNRRFMIDGNRPSRGIEWACMCSRCFITEKAEIGWGKGQLYTNMDSGAWLMTGGFPPDEEY